MTIRETEILNKVREIILANIDVNRIILFGSRAKNKNRTGSDFDFAVDTSRKYNEKSIQELKDQVEKIAGLYKVDIVFLEEVDKEFKEIIFETGKVIYEKGS